MVKDNFRATIVLASRNISYEVSLSRFLTVDENVKMFADLVNIVIEDYILVAKDASMPITTDVTFESMAVMDDIVLYLYDFTNQI